MNEDSPWVKSLLHKLSRAMPVRGYFEQGDMQVQFNVIDPLIPMGLRAISGGTRAR